jgi:hypothetical protein
VCGGVCVHSTLFGAVLQFQALNGFPS